MMNAGLAFDGDDDDVSVDELKVITEEELVSEAMKEAFKIGEAGSLSRAVDSASAIYGRKKEKRGHMNVQEHDDEIRAISRRCTDLHRLDKNKKMTKEWQNFIC